MQVLQEKGGVNNENKPPMSPSKKENILSWGMKWHIIDWNMKLFILKSINQLIN